MDHCGVSYDAQPPQVNNQVLAFNQLNSCLYLTHCNIYSPLTLYGYLDTWLRC